MLDINSNPNANTPQAPGGHSWHMVAGAVIILAAIVVAVFFMQRNTRRDAAEKEGEPSLFQNVPPGPNPFLNLSEGKLEPSAPDCTKEPTNIAKDTCFQSKAVTEKNVVFCSSIKESTPFVSKDACLNLVARAKKDKTICASISDKLIKKNCEAMAK